MSYFKTAEHICSWAELNPGNNESAGKRNTYLSSWYWRLMQNKGAKESTIALARKLLVIIYTMLKSGTIYDDSSFNQRRKIVNKSVFLVIFLN
jgi:transposase